MSPSVQQMPGLDDCVHTVDWNPIVAAQSTSTFAGLFTGFVFASIIVILTNREKIDSHNGGAEAGMALQLLLSAFFGLAIVAYLDGVVRGEQVCRRAQTESVINGAALAVSAVIVMVALSWVVLAFDRHHDGVLTFFRRVVVFASLFVILMLVVSSNGFLDGTLPGSHAHSNKAMYAVGIAGMVIALVHARWRRLYARSAKGAQGASEDIKRITRRVKIAAWGSLTLCGSAAAASSWAAGRSLSHWESMPKAVAYPAAWLALVFPIGVIVLAVRALAHVEKEPRRAATGSGTPMSPPQQRQGPGEASVSGSSGAG
ncbi:hypothetical protein SAMN05216267_107410 [Actinacidiphila rubida]|uniref:Uncharacterized protein n=1 Tax=Actinacidiphila rubida TaxID=310780 RepID=A0A1H8UIN7_9ACTN|nr:hypothetical protein SAMN05216267_107410 [Actinacidiphila rubida]